MEILGPIQLNKSPVLSKVPKAPDDAPSDCQCADDEQSQEDDDICSEPFWCHGVYRVTLLKVS